MEQLKMPEVETRAVATASGTCVNCEVRAAVPGHSTNLCDECRTLFIKYPIPLWIKLFAGCVCLVILFSLFTFPDNLSLAVHLQRGKKAVKNNRYVTASKEMQKVLQKHPQHIEARAYLMLAAFYNGDQEMFDKCQDELQGVEIENAALVGSLVYAQNSLSRHFVDDSLSFFAETNDSLARPVRDSLLRQYLQRHPDNVAAQYGYASTLYEAGRYTTCDSVLVKLLENDDTFIPSLQMMADTKRQLKDYNAAIKYCERILEINKESAHTYAMLARTHLQQKRNNEGLEMAAKALSIDDSNQYVRATLALALHFTNQFERRDEMLKEAKASKDSTASYYFDYVNDVINNKESFR